MSAIADTRPARIFTSQKPQPVDCRVTNPFLSVTGTICIDSPDEHASLPLRCDGFLAICLSEHLNRSIDMISHALSRLFVHVCKIGTEMTHGFSQFQWRRYGFHCIDFLLEPLPLAIVLCFLRFVFQRSHYNRQIVKRDRKVGSNTCEWRGLGKQSSAIDDSPDTMRFMLNNVPQFVCDDELSFAGTVGISNRNHLGGEWRSFPNDHGNLFLQVLQIHACRGKKIEE